MGLLAGNEGRSVRGIQVQSAQLPHAHQMPAAQYAMLAAK
jgi:hypothetical protein